MQPERPLRVLAVLGMHRSGTSCLAGSLQVGGLELGQANARNRYNSKGNRENREVVALNGSVLMANGLDWKHAVPARGGWRSLWRRPRPAWEEQHRDRARRILARNARFSFWGFKDPRTLMVLDGWYELVPDIELVGIFRHPLAVANSLASRPEIPVAPEDRLRIWFEYNRELLRAWKRRSFPVVCFDWEEERFNRALDALNVRLGLNPIPPGQRFFSSSLQHQSGNADARLEPRVRRLYHELQELSFKP